MGVSNEWFAPATNLISLAAPINQPGKQVYTGAWYDGWETRRHNPGPFDWAVIRLGVASGTVDGVEINTGFFDGNHAEFISVEGCFRPDDGADEELLSWKDTTGGWEPILSHQPCSGATRHAWKLLSSEATEKRYTHVRLNMYPDGGIARFRLYGHAVPVFPADANAIFDLAAAQNGGVAVAWSDEHYGTAANLLLPGRGVDMGDGWETKRSRVKGHVDWVVVRLGAPGTVDRVLVDTAFFRGNYPTAVKIDGLKWTGEGEPGVNTAGWVEVVGEQRTGPDAEHEYPAIAGDKVLTHVKLTMIPDGGVKRLRIFGRRAV